MIDINSTLESLSSSSLISSVFGTLPPEISSKLSLALSISSIALIIFIIYILVLIVTKLLSIRDSRNLRIIKNNVEDINRKLDHVTHEHLAHIRKK